MSPVKSRRLFVFFLLVSILSVSACAGEPGIPAGKRVFHQDEAARVPSTINAWPGLLGMGRTSISRETNFSRDWNTHPPRTLWTVEMGDDGFAVPSIAAGKVFILDHRSGQEIVRAINLSTGKDVWTYAYPDEGRGRYGHGRSAPLWDEGRLYTLSRKGVLHCLEADNGKRIWAINIITKYKGELPRWQMSFSPLVDGDKLIILTGGQKNVAALDKKTGKSIWLGGNDDVISYASPYVAVVAGTRQYVIFSGENLMGVRPDDGSVLWQFPWVTRRKVHVAQPRVIDSNRIFISTGYGDGCALVAVKGNKATQVWRNKNMVAHFSSPILYQGFLYGNSDPDHLVCLDPNSGKLQWKAAGFQKGGLIMADGHIIALGGKTGELFLVKADPQRYIELGRIKPLGGQSWTPPALSDGKLVIRNRTQLTCLDLVVR